MRKILSAFSLILLSLSRTSCGALLTGLLMAFAVCSCQVNEAGRFDPDGKVFTATATVTDFVFDGATKTSFSINDNKMTFAFEDDDILRI